MAILNTASLTSNILDTQGEKVSVTTKSNTNRTNQVENDVIVLKTSEKDWAIPKDKIKVTTTITNNTDIDIENSVKIKDTLSEGATFNTGSVIIGSTPYPDLNPLGEGFTLPINIGGSGGEAVISYEINIDEYVSVNSIKNQTNVDLNIESKPFSLSSNEQTITILNNEVWISKTANTRIVKSGDELTYTILITNTGTLTNTDLVFTDTIPSGTIFVEDSVKINNEVKQGYNPTNSFPLEDLAPDGEIIIEFKVTVQ